MGDILYYFRKNVRIAFKSIRFNIKQLIPFFIAVFVIQFFFGLITMSSDNNNDIEFGYVNEKYNYHIVLKDLNSSQYVYIVNETNARRTRVHEIVRVYDRNEPGTYNQKRDIYIFFKDEPQKSFEVFKSRYYDELASLNESGLKVASSPLIKFNENLRANTISYLFSSLLIMALSVFFLMALYIIRNNYYKFTYGVYMSFGADYKKLVELSFWEMVLISVFTIVPAFGLAYLVNYLIYTSAGEIFNFYPSCFIKILAFSFIISAVSVLFPMKLLSRKTPLSLIIAEDNSNLVVSPRRSTEMYGVQFPDKYERVSLWRFRKYNVGLLATAGAFGVLYMCVLFYANMYTIKLKYESPEFAVTFGKSDYNYSYNDEIKDEIYEIPGVLNIEKRIVSTASELSSHIAVDASDTLPLSNLVILGDDSEYRATKFVEYSPADSEIVKYLKRYKYVGDLNLILSDDNQIIVSNSFNNTNKFKYKPGDKIRIAKFISRMRRINDYYTGNELLKEELKYYNFEYIEFTICAVLLDNPTLDNMPVYMSNRAYENLTDKEVEYKSVSIFVDQNLTIDELNQTHEELRKWADYYAGVTVKDLHTLSIKNIEAAKQKVPIYIVIAFIVLAISPIIWFFSNILFYLKRENEFNIIQAFGAIMSEIRRIYIIDAYYNAALGVIFCLIMNIAGVFAIYKFVNVVLPKFNNEYIRYSFYLPPIPFIIGLVIIAACGFLSVYIPFTSYRSRKRRAQSAPVEFDSD